MSLVGTLVTPDSVRQQKARLDPMVRAYDKVARSCTEINAPTLGAWLAFVAAWGLFRDAPEGILTAGQEYDYAVSQERELNKWGDFFRAHCGLQSPVLVDPDVNNPHLPDFGSLADSTKILVGVALITLIVLVWKS